MGNCGSQCCQPASQDFIVGQGSHDLELEQLSPRLVAAKEREHASEAECSPNCSSDTRTPTSTSIESLPESNSFPPPSDAQRSFLEALSDAARPSSQTLDALLQTVHELCRKGRVFDAMEALQKLEQDLSMTGVADIAAIGRLLDGGALVVELRQTYARAKKMLTKLGPEVLPQGDGDNRWACTTIHDPQVDKNFRADIQVRFAVGSERDKGGPSAQIITCGMISNFPLDVHRFVALYRETDLYQKEWMLDCELSNGKVAGLENMYAASSHIVNSSPLLPMKVDVLTIREFIICSDPLFPDRDPGVLIVDASPPQDMTSFAGSGLPQQAPRSVRISSMCLVMYLTPSRGRPGYSDVFVIAKAGLPVPEWILPLTLIKKFLANYYVNGFRSAKAHIVDKWADLDYERRIMGCPDFYESATGIGAQ